MECWATFQRTMNETQRLNYAMLNYLSEEMEYVAGLRSTPPRLQVPVPNYIKSAPVTMNTTNNIHVEAGSQVGQINAGAIVYLNKAVSTFSAAGLKDLAAGLQGFSQQVVDSKELSAAAQTEILDLLRALVEQLPKKKEERNYSLFKLSLQTIGTLVTATTAIAPHWEKLKHLFESLFKN